MNRTCGLRAKDLVVLQAERVLGDVYAPQKTTHQSLVQFSLTSGANEHVNTAAEGRAWRTHPSKFSSKKKTAFFDYNCVFFYKYAKME